jgi:fatty-acyl-CoA synthase
MHATMMNVPLSLNHLLDRAGQLFPDNQVVSRLPDKTLRTHNCAQIHAEPARSPRCRRSSV